MRVPQHDRVGKRDAFRGLQLTPPGVLTSMWWLFVCNIGQLTREVIGSGIVHAELCATWPEGVELLFRRADATEARLTILEDRHGGYKTRLSDLQA